MNTSTIKSDERIIFELRSIYNRFGYSRYRMSKFEEYEFYLHNKDFLHAGEPHGHAGRA